MALTVWSVAELIRNGFTFWVVSILIYLALVGSMLWIRREDMVKNLSSSPNSAQENRNSEDSENAALEIVLKTIRTKGKVQRHDLLPQVGLSRSSLGRLLDQMEAQGLIRQIGDRKATYYVLGEKSAGNL